MNKANVESCGQIKTVAMTLGMILTDVFILLKSGKVASRSDVGETKKRNPEQFNTDIVVANHCHGSRRLQ